MHVDGAARLLAGINDQTRVDYARHRRHHGYPALRRRSWLIEALRNTRMLGRGGAAFPIATKLAAVPSQATTRILINGSESEPASRKDRTLMTVAPHLILDGALVVASALQTSHVTVVVHDRGAAARSAP